MNYYNTYYENVSELENSIVYVAKYIYLFLLIFTVLHLTFTIVFKYCIFLITYFYYC
jgi:hypothetical protein